MKVSILTIGDEVINGKIINTNASFIARILEVNHFEVERHLAVKDDKTEIIKALEILYQNSDIVITTGGLGPTIDDLTKEASSSYFNEELIYFPEVYKTIEAYFSASKRKMPENNKKQAYFIEGSIVVDNNYGTAPGMIYEKLGKTIINLPGPPQELEPMLNETVVPFLRKKINVKGLKKEYRLMNIGESLAESLITSLYDNYPNVKIAPYASVGVIDYVILVKDENNKKSFEKCCQEFETILKDYIIGDWSQNIQEIIVHLLSEKNLTIAIAESCTGGMLASRIVDVSGSSKVFKEGMITYSNQAKVNRLGVKQSTLDTYGAVSSGVAKEMAEGIKKVTNSDIGISVTGVAGPTGGTKEKPVGLVYSAIHYKGKTNVYKNYFLGDRLKIRERSVGQVLFELYKLIK